MCFDGVGWVFVGVAVYECRGASGQVYGLGVVVNAGLGGGFLLICLGWFWAVVLRSVVGGFWLCFGFVGFECCRVSVFCVGLMLGM